MSGANFCNTEHVKGRKHYRCEWCYKPIAKATTHVKVVGVFDGEFSSYRLHNECEKPCFDSCNDNDGFFTPGEGAGFDQSAFVNKWQP